MTTGKVIRFPRRAEREWSALESTIRDRAEASGWEEEKIKVICGRIKDHYTVLDYLVELESPIRLPEGLSEEQISSISDSIKLLEKELVDRVSVLLTEALKRVSQLEIELYEAKEDPSSAE